MLRLKKEKEERAAALAAECASGATTDASSTDSGMDVEDEGGEKKKGVSLLGGIGGKKLEKKASAGGKKRTPGEIRIQKDIVELDGGKVANVTFPNSNDLTLFKVRVSPDTGYWKGAKYDFTFTIPPLYPHDAPKVHCDTQIYHPNINEEGNVCLNILREDWKPVLDINAVIYGLIYLFYDPNPDDPLNHKAAKLLRENRTQFGKTVTRTLQGSYHEGVSYPKLL